MMTPNAHSANNEKKIAAGGIDMNDPARFPGVDMTYPNVPPPYSTIKYSEGYSEKKPFGQGKISKNALGETEILPKEIGAYLIALTVSEFRNNKKITSYQRVFRMQVRT